MKYGEYFNYADPNAQTSAAELVFLQKWSDEQWQQLLNYTELRNFEPGDLLIRLGDVERALYILVEGEVEVLISSQDGETTYQIGIRETGAVIGEQAFIDESPRSATIRALATCSAMRLSWNSYEILRVREPKLAHDILFDLARVMSVKLRQATAEIAT